MSSPEDHNRAFTLFPLELEVPADSNQTGNMQPAIMPRAHLKETPNILNLQMDKR